MRSPAYPSGGGEPIPNHARGGPPLGRTAEATCKTESSWRGGSSFCLGEKIGGFALTEPEAGGDVASMKATVATAARIENGGQFVFARGRDAAARPAFGSGLCHRATTSRRVLLFPDKRPPSSANEGPPRSRRARLCTFGTAGRAPCRWRDCDRRQAVRLRAACRCRMRRPALPAGSRNLPGIVRSGAADAAIAATGVAPVVYAAGLRRLRPCAPRDRRGPPP